MLLSLTLLPKFSDRARVTVVACLSVPLSFWPSNALSLRIHGPHPRVLSHHRTHASSITALSLDTAWIRDLQLDDLHARRRKRRLY